MHHRYDAINIPTELLRTIVAIEDLGSTSAAAQALGLTQPAISAQIKRLQVISRSELFRKVGSGLQLTEAGTALTKGARRILAINDQMLMQARGSSSSRVLSVGLPTLYGMFCLTDFLINLREIATDQKFHVHAASDTEIRSSLDNGLLDIALTTAEPQAGYRAYRQWREHRAWVCSPDLSLSMGRPFPIINMPQNVLQQQACEAIRSSGSHYSFTVTAHDWGSLFAALRAGCGLAVLPTRFVENDLKIATERYLPELSDIPLCLYVREDIESESVLKIADELHAVVSPPMATVEPIRSVQR